MRRFIRSPAMRRGLVLAAPVVLTPVAYLGAFALRFDFQVPASQLERFIVTLPYLMLLRLALWHRFRLHSGYWQHVSVRDVLRLVGAASVGSLVFPVILALVNELRGILPSVLALDWVLWIGLTGGLQLGARWTRERAGRNGAPAGRRTFVVGAGEAGEQLVRQFLHQPEHGVHVVGLIDDDAAKRGRSLHGVPVLGTADELRGLVAVHRVQLILIAIPSATPSQLRRLVDRGVDAGADVKLLPPLKDLVTSDAHVSQVRDVQIEDLLAREPVSLELAGIAPAFAGKVVVVTGAGGSIGSELARQIARFQPLQLVLVDRAESPLYFTQMEVSRANPAIDVVPVLASVTNADRLRQVFESYRPDCLFHAAAYKHVPMLERNIVEGVWNNIFGTLRVAQCAALFGVQKFVLISTDKAVNPRSVLGATKFIAERIVLELPSLRGSETDFRVVRFGNVLGSDGSVVPLFKRQLAAGGPLTVTHPEVRRYFMTIPEAVQLLLQAVTLPEAAGRIALLEMGEQVRVLDLAEHLVRLAGLVPHRDVEIVFTGLRPGEKLLEELVGPGETAVPTSVDKIRVVERNGVHGDELAKRLRSLRRIAVSGTHDRLIRALSTLVPAYHSPPPTAAGYDRLPVWPAAATSGRGAPSGNGRHLRGRNGAGGH
jgi:FlaA1/EpsC-like NDP-sugar epimerase